MFDKQISNFQPTNSVYSDSSFSTKPTQIKKNNFLSRAVSSFPNTGNIKALISKVMTAISKIKVSFNSEKPSRPLSAEKNSDGSHSVALSARGGADFVGGVASTTLGSKNEADSSDYTSELNTADSNGVDSIQKHPPVSKAREKVLERVVTPPVMQRGELITADFKDADGHVFCQESAQRTRNVEVLEGSLKAQLEALNNHEKANPASKNNPQNKARRQHIESNLRALNSIKEERAKSGRSPPTWASTDAPRAHFRRHVNKLVSGAKWLDLSQKKILRQMGILDAKKESLAVTGNMRYQQTFIVSDEELEGYNHPDLKGMITGENPGKVVKDPQTIERFNLYHALKDTEHEGGGDLSKLETDPSFRREISLLKKEMAALGKKTDSEKILGIIKHLEETPISYLVPDGKGIVRSASITDFMHGETNVEDIRILTSLWKMGFPITEDSYAKLSANEKTLLNKYYLGSLFKDQEFQPHAAEELKDNLYNDVTTAYPEKDFANVINTLEEIALERDAHLMEKALQDLSAHLSNHPVKADALSLFFGRVGLVDTIKKAKQDPDGFYLNERSMAMDSASAYRMLQGKKIVFDGKPDSTLMQDFDDSNVIHAPSNWSKGPHEVSLKASYLNASIAGNLDNIGVQETINSEEVDALETILNDSELKDNLRAQELMQNIKKGTVAGSEGGNFSVVADALELMSMLGHASVNCYGGKDRTGYVCAVHDQRKMMTHLQKLDDPRYVEGGSFFAALGRQMFAYSGIAVGVIRDNVAISAVKIARADLGLLLDGEIVDYMKGATRLAINGVQFIEGFLPKIISSNLQKLANVQSGEGDLYN